MQPDMVHSYLASKLIADLGITGGDNAKLGYYAGLIESLFYVPQAATILQWGRISDRIGRKPILLVGLMGSALSMLCFGLSRTFATLVISRCLCGVLNGNAGVMKSTMSEALDATNRAQGFALLPVVWSLGTSIAPVMGGSLARPQERFPAYFKGEFWRLYPYFLSCLGPAIFIFISFLIALFFLEETLTRRRTHSHSTSSFAITPAEERSRPVPLRELLTYPVVLSVSNYATLASMDIIFISLLPLFMAMPIELGGLGFTPMVIGYVLGTLGVWTGISSVLFCARLIHRFGEKRVFIAGMLIFCVNSTMLPPD
ncbi:major facilitator superfamily domain-containing protein [Amanita rubescens]|nr:major facilitator superfamily domain-containing protein [Amanita rubescens]